MTTDLMIDLETLGNSPRAVILAIGAVYIEAGRLAENFYCTVDAESCVRAGLEMDVDTVLWWMRQGDAARAAISRRGEYPIQVALEHFADFLDVAPGSVNERVRVWGNGASFDNAILASAYRAHGHRAPWAFWNDRCYRTLRDLYPSVPRPVPSTAHHALHDAEAQARHLIEILEHHHAPTRTPA